MLQPLLQLQLIKVLNHTMPVFSCYEKVFFSTSPVGACPEIMLPSLLDADDFGTLQNMQCGYNELQTSHFPSFLGEFHMCDECVQFPV